MFSASKPPPKLIAIGTVEAEYVTAEQQTRAASQATGPVYAYLFHHPNSMDMRGRINYFGGASHSSDLPFLMGPSLYREIGRKRLTQLEDKLCKKIRSLFAEFIKGG